MNGLTGACIAVGLLSGMVLMARLRTLARSTGEPPASTVSVIIPARDEEARLPQLLRSLAAQLHPPLEVLVVDDGSTDSTAALAREAGVSLIRAPAPPQGWLGKPWACHLGSCAARGDLLVFLDADVVLEPDAIQSIAEAHARLAPAGLLSVQPYHSVEQLHEQLSAVCNAVSVLGSGIAAVGPTPVSRMAFGPCLATRPRDLREVGGFEAVAADVVEDIALARAYGDAGRPVVCLGGARTVRFRMYPEGLATLVEGWTKNLAAGAARAPWWPRLGTAAWVGAGIAILASAMAGWSWTVTAAWALYSIELWWILRRLGSFHPLTAVVFPIPLVTFLALFARSTLLRLLHRPIIWRGRRLVPGRSWLS